MKTYKKLESKDDTFLKNVKAGLVADRGQRCASCHEKRSLPKLGIYVIDDEKPPEGKNLILLDESCRAGILSCVDQLEQSAGWMPPDWHRWVYGGDRNPIKDRRWAA